MSEHTPAGEPDTLTAAERSYAQIDPTLQWRGRWYSEASVERILAARAADRRHDDLAARVRVLVHSEEADRFRDEAARGVAVLPYASNRYMHLLDNLRALLPDAPDEGGAR